MENVKARDINFLKLFEAFRPREQRLHLTIIFIEAPKAERTFPSSQLIKTRRNCNILDTLQYCAMIVKGLPGTLECILRRTI